MTLNQIKGEHETRVPCFFLLNYVKLPFICWKVSRASCLAIKITYSCIITNLWILGIIANNGGGHREKL